MDFTIVSRSGGHDDVHVGKDPDAELEVFVFPADVLGSRDVNLWLRNGHHVDERLLVRGKEHLSVLAADLGLEVDDAATGRRELPCVEVGNLREREREI